MKVFTRGVIIGILLCVAAFSKAVPPAWHVEPNVNFYQNTMSVVAVLNINGTESTDANDMVGVFVGATCRGVANPNTVVLTRNYAFITIYSNASANEVLTFKIYDASLGVIYEATPDTVFENNGILGTINDPFVIYTSFATGVKENFYAAATVFPNPFTETLSIVFPEAQGTKTITVRDLASRLIYTAETQTATFTWDGNDEGEKTVSPGLYFLTINHNHTSQTYPIIKNHL